MCNIGEPHRCLYQRHGSKHQHDENMPTSAEPVTLTPEEIKRQKYNAERRAYYLANKERVRARRKEIPSTSTSSKKYYEKNKGRILMKAKTYSQTDEYKARSRARWSQKLGSQNDYLRGYRKKNKEAIKAKREESRRLNPEHFKAINDRYFSSEKGRKQALNYVHVKGKAIRDSYRKSARGKRAISKFKKSPKGIASRQKHDGRRRALFAGAAVGDLEPIIAWEVRVRRRACVPCYWCGEPTPGKSAHLDHVVPLSRGGRHAIDNLCASCPACNLRKNSKLPNEWNKTLKQPVLL
jgi:5-methylcytosine-specific restriction endonuclease McrA